VIIFGVPCLVICTDPVKLAAAERIFGCRNLWAPRGPSFV
jgi:hypothetical protein